MVDLNRIVNEIRNYEGVKRKNPIKHLINQFKPYSNYGNTVIDFGDDAAVLKNDCNYLLLAADGIWASLLKDLFWAGYCSVLVNVNDIYAMGGTPIAMVNIMSLKKTDNCKDLLEGIKTGCDKFKVPMVGGHLHPDTETTTVSVSIMGNATKILSSFSAKEGEDIILSEFFPNKTDGFYVDVGAHHPMRFSNTHMFYKKGWRGINIDAMPGSMKAFERKRPRDINLEIGVSGKEGEMTFYMFDDPALNGFSMEISKDRDKNSNFEILRRRERFFQN